MHLLKFVVPAHDNQIHLTTKSYMVKPFEVPPALKIFHDQSIDGLEFCKLAYARFDEIITLPDDGHTLRERKGYIKQLIEEILPICRHIQTFYSQGRYLSVRWMHGSQHFDAKVQSTGTAVDRGWWPSEGTLEVTQAVHVNEHLSRELLNADGACFGLDGITRVKDTAGKRRIESKPTAYHNESYIFDMCSIILKAIAPKVSKMADGHYPADTTLIVDCALITIFAPHEWEKLVSMVRDSLPSHGFKRIFLTATSEMYYATL